MRAHLRLHGRGFAASEEIAETIDAEILRPRILLPPPDRQRAVSVAGDHAERDPASGADIVTVSLRREAAGGKTGDAFWSLIRELDVTVLPNTAGCRSVREAVTTAKLARELFATSWIKLEVIADNDTLQPDVVGLVEAAAILIKDGFEVFPYCTEDLGVAMRLVDAGCKVVMPWAAPIGSARGIINRDALKLLRDRLPDITLVVDAGLGAPCHAARGARTRLRRGAAQHRDCKGRRSRRDGESVSPAASRPAAPPLKPG